MNIPEEADKRYPERADDHAGRQEYRRMGFEAGAEWARKEALLEAADMADRMYAGTDGTTAEREWIGGVRATARNIRALAEGDN